MTDQAEAETWGRGGWNKKLTLCMYEDREVGICMYVLGM
jgi:hypothetical protein